MSDTPEPAYLKPYAEAARAVGARFEALLWLSRESQTARFATIAAMLDSQAGAMADFGCGRADLLEHLLDAGLAPARYIGIDGVEAMVAAGNERITARRIDNASCRFDDFVANQTIFADLARDMKIDTFVFSGSLNTLTQEIAEAVLDRAFAALPAGGVLIFNFLSSEAPNREGNSQTGPARRFKTLALVRFALDRTPLVRFACDYLGGHDATIRMERP
ncbi:MAG: class I SAM-dependent methyltransferase [Phycisphaeraceae bacterium]|nr:class I SAM-dependent methyltransferase [Phycisphaeraceae bacterium]MCW5762234.1 class I SAM-dependent methyltransferase [Phycisphaeraceae bacterium]